MSSYNVSIITVCKNSEETIRKTIESVLHQTYKNIEYIIIDGESTDRTTEIIKEYQNIFEGRLWYISEKDQGIYDAMNKGILHATGDIIGIINSDDWYEPDAVERIVAAYERHTNANAICAQANIVSENLIIDKTKNKFEEEIWKGMPLPHPGVFVLRETYSRFGLYDTGYRIAADYDFIFRLYINNARFEILDDALVNFQMGGISTTELVATAVETWNVVSRYLQYCPMPLEIKALHRKYILISEFKEMLSRSEGIILSDLLQCFDHDNRKFSILGSGYWGKQMHKYLTDHHMSVECFLDNDRTKWGDTVLGTKVYSPDWIFENEETNCILAIMEPDQKVIDQLKEYSKGKHFQWVAVSEIMHRVVPLVYSADFIE